MLGDIWKRITDLFVQGLGKNAFYRSLSFGILFSAVQAANFVKQYAEAGITTPLFSDYPPPPRIFERQVGAQAGKIGLVRAAFFVKSDTNTPAQKEFVAKLEARVQKELNEAHDVTY